MKRTEDSLRDFWDNIKCINIQIIEVPGEEDKKKKGSEKFFDKITIETSPAWERKQSSKFKKC